MRKLIAVSAMAVASALWCAPVSAQDNTQAAAQGSTPAAQDGTQAAAAQPDPMDQVQCKDGPPATGSRFGGVRRCMTKKQWVEEEDAANRARGMRDQDQVNIGGGVRGIGGGGGTGGGGGMGH